MNHLGDEIVAVAADRELRVAVRVSRRYRLDSRDGLKALRSISVVCGEDDGSLRTVPVHQARRRINVNNASVFNDRYAITQPFGLLHEMGSKENGLSAL